MTPIVPRSRTCADVRVRGRQNRRRRAAAARRSYAHANVLVVRATLPFNDLHDDELTALAEVFEELGKPTADLDEQVTAVLLGPVVGAVREERCERSAGRRTHPVTVDLRLPEAMANAVLAFFGGFDEAIAGSEGGCIPAIAAAFAPLVAAIRGSATRP